VVFELVRAGVVSEVVMEVVFVAATEVFLFYLVNVGQVAGPGDIDLALVN
jgi:hypothetical protein